MGSLGTEPDRDAHTGKSPAHKVTPYTFASCVIGELMDGAGRAPVKGAKKEAKQAISRSCSMRDPGGDTRGGKQRSA